MKKTIGKRKNRITVYALVSGKDGYPWLSTISCTDYWLPQHGARLEKEFPKARKFRIKKFTLTEAL